MASDQISRPIFILGTGRGGTTIFLKLLGSHPDLAWVSNYTNRFPKHPQLAVLSRLLDVRWFSRLLSPDWKITPKPVEPIRALDYVTNGTFSRQDSLCKTDVTPEIAAQFRRMVAEHLRWHGKRRFLNKHTGFPRISFLKEIFPDAIFINVIRDGRAVASSLLNMHWWDGTMKSWWWGPMAKEYEGELARYENEPIILAAIVWKTLIDKISAAIRALPVENVITVRYDFLIADYKEVMREIVDFCDLNNGERFNKRLDTFDIRQSDDHWKSQLTSRQREFLEESLAGHLKNYGFLK